MNKINRATFLGGLAAGVLGMGSGSQAGDAPAASRPPNLIFILADDLGYGDLGCYGQTKIQTPHLDQMARDGMRFTDFYAASSVCGPARCALVTGLHTGHCRIRGNASGQTLLPTDPGIAKTLKTAGYTTACIGKWGLGDPGLPGVPSKQGFDYFYGYLTHGHAHNYYPTYLYRSENGANETRVSLQNVNPNEKPEGMGEATVKRDYTPDLFNAEVLRWVKAHKNERFFLYYTPTIPHGNNQAHPHEMEVPDLGAYADKPWPDEEKRKAAMISRLDTYVGTLLALLRELSLDKNTLVFFTSDNGPHNEGVNPDFFDSNGPLRGIKRALYEGGIRVPMIAQGPGIAAKSITAAPGYFPDILPTLAQMVNTPLTAPTDGISLLPTLRGNAKNQKPHPYLYWEFYENGGARAVRQNDWKAVRTPFDAPIELYDLKTDVGEKNNVAEKHPDIVQKMEALMKEAHVPSPLYNAQTAKAGAKAKPAAPKEQ